MSETAADTFRRTCAATHSVKVCKPWVLLCRTSKTNGLTEAIVLGKVVGKLYWAEDTDSGEVDEGGQRWVFIIGSEWERDCFLSKSQVYRALEKLEALGFVAQRRVQRRQRNGELGGNPVRHVTMFGDAIGEALEALERGEWDPEPLLREVASSRGRDEACREDATRSAPISSRERDEVDEPDREGAPSSSRVRDEVSRNKEEIPPSNTPEVPSTSASDVASDAGSGQGDELPVGRSLTPQQVLGAAIAVEFGYDPLLRDPDQKRQVLACVGKLAKRDVTGDDIDEIRALAWFARGKEPKITPAALGEAWGRWRGNAPAEVVQRRSEAEEIVAAASEALGRPLIGTDQVEAEYAVAVLLARGKTRALVKRALQLQGSDPWSLNYLQTAATRVEQGGGAVRPSAMVPEGLDDLTDRQLVDLLRADPPSGDVDRIGAEIAARLAAPGAEQYQRAAEVRGLIDGREGWPRGMGAANKLRMTLGVTLDGWLAANRPATSAALTRGA